MRRVILFVSFLTAVIGGAVFVAGPPTIRSPRYWLFEASHNGYVRVVKALLAVGVQPTEASLAEAAWEGHEDVVAALLAARADANGVAHSSDGDLSPLIAAARRGHPAICKMLLEAGANPRQRVGGKTPVGAAIIGKQPALVRLFLERGADPNEPQSFGEHDSFLSNPLGMSAATGDVESTELLLAAGADPDSRSSAGETALMIAAQSGAVGAVRALLSAKANPALRDAEHHTVLDYALPKGNKDVVALLVPSYVPDKGVTVEKTPSRWSNGGISDGGIIRAECGESADGVCRMACKGDYVACMRATDFSPSCLDRFCDCTAPCGPELCKADGATLHCGRDWLATANGTGHGLFKSTAFDGQFYISGGRFVMSGRYMGRAILCDVTDGIASLWECLARYS